MVEQAFINRSFSNYNYNPNPNPNPSMLEPRVVLFPLMGAGNSETVKAPSRTMSSRQAQQLRSMIISPEKKRRVLPPPTMTTMTAMPPSSNQEIEELKRRLEVIKRRRAQQREHYLHLNNSFITINHELSPVSGDAPGSVSSRTAAETISTDDTSQSWNPRRLLCSSYKTPKEPVVRSKFRQTRPNQIGTATTQEDPLDKIVCMGRMPNNSGEQRYSTLVEEDGSLFDPYAAPEPARIMPQHHRVGDTKSYELHHRVASLEDSVPRGMAYSEIDSEESEPFVLQSCTRIPKRHIPWYVRPLESNNVIPDAEDQKIMQMVYFTTE